MRTAILIACAAAACAAISACGPNPADDAGAPVDAGALPHPKAGLWQWSSKMAGSRQLCLSGQLLTVFAERPGCPVTRRVKTSDGAFIVEAACSAGPVKKTLAKSSGDYEKDFTVDVVLGDVSDHAEWRYLGPCPAGARVADLP